MKKLVNFRLPVAIACALSAGAVCAYFFTLHKIDAVWLTTALPVSALLIIILTATTKNLKYLIIIAAVTAFFFAGYFNCFARFNAYSRDAVTLSDRPYSITGTVKEKSAFSSGEYMIVTNAEADGKKLDADILVYLGENYGDLCDNGYKVKFYSEITKLSLFPFGKLNKNAENNVKYTCRVYGGLKSEYRFSLFGEARTAIRKTLFDNLDYDTAAVCYGMLIGETSYVEGESMQSFRYGGMAHIFAVSGLHIGIVYGLLTFLCKALRLNKYFTTIICIFCVFMYAGICGFTLSSIRAAIMCTVLSLTKLVYLKYDGLNSLAFAVIILLFLSPLNLFSAGFQLSVCAVGGIFIFSKPFTKTFAAVKPPDIILRKIKNNKLKRFIAKIKVPPKIASALSVSLAAQTGTLPVMLVTFGYISGAGLLLNVIIIPLLSALFSVLFLCAAICSAIPPAAAFIMPLATAPLDAVISFLIGVGFEKAIIYGFGAGLFIPLYYVGVLTISDKLNLKILTRAVAAVCAAVILATYVLSAKYLPLKGYTVFISAYNGGGDIIIKSANGTVLIVTDKINSYYVAEDLNKFYAFNPDAVIMLGEENPAISFPDLNVNSQHIYVFDGNLHLQPFKNAVIYYETSFNVCGIDFRFEDGYTLSVACGGTNIFVSCGKKLPAEKCDLLISLNENTVADCDYKVYFTLSGADYCIYDSGDIVFYANEGKLKKTNNFPNVIF